MSRVADALRGPIANDAPVREPVDVRGVVRALRDAGLNMVTSENSPAEWLAQRAFPDFKSSTPGIYSEEIDPLELAMNFSTPMAGLMKVEKLARAGKLSSDTLGRLPSGGVPPTAWGKRDIFGRYTVANWRRDLRAPADPPADRASRIDKTDAAVVRNAVVRGDASIIDAPEQALWGMTIIDEGFPIYLNDGLAPPRGVPAGTFRRSVLEHELGERATMSGDAPVLSFGTHAGTEPRLRELYAASRNPAVFRAAEESIQRQPGKLEREFLRLYREHGGTAGRPIAPGSRAAKKVHERMRGTFDRLATETERERAEEFMRLLPGIADGRGGRAVATALRGKDRP